MTPASICPGGGFRRRQNIYRWIGTRTRAGDSVPEAPTADGGSIQNLLKDGRSWALLLFEGTPEGNAENARFINDAATLSCDQLCAMGDSMKVSPGSGFVGGIDTVIVLPFEKCKEAHDMFGVRGQCLMLVRPDFHVGLRSEPIREGAVYRYFKDACKMVSPPVKEKPAPASASYNDNFPTMFWALITIALGAGLATSSASSGGGANKILMGTFLFSCLVNCVLYMISKPPH